MSYYNWAEIMTNSTDIQLKDIIRRYRIEPDEKVDAALSELEKRGIDTSEFAQIIDSLKKFEPKPVEDPSVYKRKYRKILKTSLIIAVLFVLLIRFKPIWERNPGGAWNILFYAAVAVLFFWLHIKIILEVIRLIKRRKHLSIVQFMPILIMIVVLLDVSYNFFKVDLTRLYGKVIFMACYEGTQNQATLKLYENNKFEIHWTGVFFYDEYFNGTYQIQHDTIFFDYKKRKPTRFGSKILMDNEEQVLQTIMSDSDSSMYYVPFYYGNCKGLN